jgi:hypothetical protein
VHVSKGRARSELQWDSVYTGAMGTGISSNQQVLRLMPLSGCQRISADVAVCCPAQGSLNTFLNAFTYPDRTCYPVASCNQQVFAYSRCASSLLNICMTRRQSRAVSGDIHRISTTWWMCTWMRFSTRTAYATQRPLRKRVGTTSWRHHRQNHSHVFELEQWRLAHCGYADQLVLDLNGKHKSSYRIPSCTRAWCSTR